MTNLSSRSIKIDKNLSTCFINRKDSEYLVMEWHGIIVGNSLINEAVLETFDIIGKKDGSWTLYKIAVQNVALKKAIQNIQKNMIDGAWYVHLYNKRGSKIIVIFKDKVFETDSENNGHTEITDYGRTMGIPPEQLDFYPNRFSAEEF